MRLIEWREKNGFSMLEMAKLIGKKSANTIFLYESGEVMPPYIAMMRIKEVTKGKVKPSDFEENFRGIQ